MLPYPTSLDYNVPNNAQFLNDVISPDIFNSSETFHMVNTPELSNFHSKQIFNSQIQHDDIVRVNNQMIFSNSLGLNNNSVVMVDKKMSNDDWLNESSAKDKRRSSISYCFI